MNYIDSRHDHLCRCPGCRPQPPEHSEATSTLHLACPTCGDEIEVAYELQYDALDDRSDVPTVVSLRTYCFHAISREDTYDLLMNEGARQAELATEGER